MRTVVEKKLDKIGRREFWVGWTGGQIPKEELYALIELSVPRDSRVKHAYKSNSTIDKFSSYNCYVVIGLLVMPQVPPYVPQSRPR